MKKELENKLFEKFSQFFPGGRQVNPKKSLMYVGFDVKDGWFDLIYNLCNNLEKLKVNLIVVQVKEKLGGLRFYVESISGPVKKALQLIDKAELESYNICDVCGVPGELREFSGRCKTLCTKHYTELVERYF